MRLLAIIGFIITLSACGYTSGVKKAPCDGYKGLASASSDCERTPFPR